MKTTLEFVNYLETLGITLSIKDNNLHCSAPKNAMDNALKNELVRRKPELLEYFSIRNQIQISDLTEINTNRVYPLSCNQERLLSLQNIESKSDSSAYNISMAYYITGNLNIEVLKECLNEIQNRHSILRTIFPDNNGNTIQKILPEMPISISVFQSNCVNTSIEAVTEELSEHARKPFDIQQGPLWRCHLIDYGRQNFGLLFTMHHLIFDGWSRNVFNMELSQLYQSYSGEDGEKLNPNPVQYSMYTCWLRQCLPDIIKSQEGYWKSHITESDSELRLPYDKKRIHRGLGTAKNLCFKFPSEVADPFVQFTRSQKVSLNISLLAAFCLLLNSYTQQKKLIICTSMACRNSRKNIEGAMGFFNNIAALNISVSGHKNISSLLHEVQTNLVNAFKNQDIPFQHVAKLPGQSRIPLTKGLFAFQNTKGLQLKIPGLSIDPVEVRKKEVDFDFALHTRFDGNTLSGVFEYNADIFEEETISELKDNYFTILQSMSQATNEQHYNQLESINFHPPYSTIQNLLRKTEQVKDAAITIDESCKGSKKLVAYIILGKTKNISPDEFCKYLNNNGIPEYLIPADWIPINLESFPVIEGQINYSALPSPASIRKKPLLSDTPPQTDLQKQLALIWERILWLDEGTIGIKDNFFDLGGHSLLAVQLVREIENSIGRKIPSLALLQLSDIETLCNILETNTGEENHQQTLPEYAYHGLLAHTAGWQGNRIKPDSLVFGFNINGSRQPLFWCIHGFRPLSLLARYLGEDQPLYGMRSGHSIMEPTEENIQILANHYVTEIQAIQSHGPYLIGGNCHSARIAFAIAQRLTELDEPVSLLCLLEQFVPQDYSGRIVQIYAKNSYFNPFRYCESPQVGWSKYYSGNSSYCIVDGPHGQYFDEPYIEDLVKVLNESFMAAQQHKPTNLLVTPHKQRRLPDDAYRANINCLDLGKFDQNGVAIAKVEITNISQQDWKFAKPGDIELSYRWLYDEIDVLGWGKRVTLPCHIGAGESVTINIPITLLNGQSDGPFKIEFDLIEDGVTWFKYKGSTKSQVEVTIATKEEAECQNAGLYRRFISSWSKL